MNIYFLGTCAGTEPMPGRKHASVAIETNDRIYWFDAGEGCSYTAHLLGLDLLKVEHIFISHPHMDHVGGLGNLLWNIRKLAGVRKEQPKYGRNLVHIPSMETWEGVMMILKNTEGGFKTAYSVSAEPVKAGVLLDDGNLKITAFPNTHLDRLQLPVCMSYTYLIECEGKKLIYSGDLGKYEDLDPVIGDGCDGLIIETGHFGISDAHAYWNTKNIGRLFFTHNGREILNAPEASRQKVKNLFGDTAVICEDGMCAAF